ncbi:hypothetical protein [Nodularia sp. UHCC 0506]|uniref:hypothetical protein n=1 Tax=Nodularia sp. UHCC 0506 TaxID=3110243 RepID=UPI002B1F8BEA|nr:hypothetical protein [Nodularia sp. UHCC 0506]MEA5514949.1 hypothetical protein [Nodularia sp. UHCC 0506]
MSQLLTLELSDEVYTALHQQAIAVGLSVAELVATSLNRQYSLSVSPKSDAEEARQRLLGFAGVISMGYATGTDNESIDADLAKTYDNAFTVWADEYKG